MIKFDRVSKHYPGGHRALADVSFTIEPGSMVFLTGHSGAGKSTVLRLIMMLERASRGQVIVNDRNLGKTPDRLAPLVRQSIGMIFQDHKLLRDKTVADNVALPLVIAGLKYADIRKRVRAALDKVGLLDKEAAWPLTLSGELFALFEEVSEQGVTVLIASHDLDLIRQMRKRVLVLSSGRLADDIPAAE